LEKCALPDFECSVDEFHPEVLDLFEHPDECDGHFLEGHVVCKILEIFLFGGA